MKKIYLGLLLFICFSNAVLLHAQDKSMPAEMSKSYNEYSGMCIYGRELLFLLPQNKSPEQPYCGYLHSLDLSKLQVGADNKVTVPEAAFRRYRISNYKEVVSGISKFGGFEAIVIVKGTVFITVETDGETDYLLKGYLRDTLLTLSSKMLPIPKIRRGNAILPNAGYEAMCMHGPNLLLAYEYNYLGGDTRLYLADTSFNTLALTAVPFPPLPFRLTDMAPYKKNTYLGINYYWNFNGSMNHREAYYKEIDKAQDPDLAHWLPNECFARIVEVTMSDNGQKATWATKMLLPAKECINWEGIVPFRDGVLLISDDNKLPLLQTKLYYYPLPR